MARHIRIIEKSTLAHIFFRWSLAQRVRYVAELPKNAMISFLLLWLVRRAHFITWGFVGSAPFPTRNFMTSR